MRKVLERDHTRVTLKIMAAVLFLLLVIMLVLGAVRSAQMYSNPNIIQLNNGWVDSRGNEVDLAHIDKSIHSGDFYYEIKGNDIPRELIFSARNCYVNVYQDGVLVDADTKVEKNILGKSVGTRWHFVPIDNKDGQTIIRLNITANYQNSRIYITNIYLGDIDTIYTSIAKASVPEFIINALWIIMGYLLLIFYFFGRKKFDFSADLFYLGLCEIFCANWIGVETSFWQFLFGHSEFIHLLGYVNLAALPSVFGCLALSRLEGNWKFAAKIYTLISEFLTWLIFMLHVMGVVELHYTIGVIHILLFLNIPLSTKIFLTYARSETVLSVKKLLLTFYLILISFLLIGVIRFVTQHYEDYAFFLKCSLFLFLGILVIFQLAGLNAIIKKGMQMEFLKEMAMLDHLTKFYNRTGFAEHRASYENAEAKIGVIQFDVNNLKTVNDNYGHERGDELICLASSGIAESFGQKGNCYRMGGDEFVVILNHENPIEDYENGIEHLLVYCKQANTDPNRVADLSIAYGFAVMEKGGNLSAVLDEADSAMYSKKKEMKGL